MTHCWIVERCRCCLAGHRSLSSCAAYEATLPDGRVRELHFCLACNSPVWIVRVPNGAGHPLMPPSAPKFDHVTQN
jgi:hypothetical protein